jgi:hypothetical protein
VAAFAERSPEFVEPPVAFVEQPVEEKPQQGKQEEVEAEEARPLVQVLAR